jgi:hypothetical protein
VPPRAATRAAAAARTHAPASRSSGSAAAVAARAVRQTALHRLPAAPQVFKIRREEAPAWRRSLAFKRRARGRPAGCGVCASSRARGGAGARAGRRQAPPRRCPRPPTTPDPPPARRDSCGRSVCWRHTRRARARAAVQAPRAATGAHATERHGKMGGGQGCFRKTSGPAGGQQTPPPTAPDKSALPPYGARCVRSRAVARCASRCSVASSACARARRRRAAPQHSALALVRRFVRRRRRRRRSCLARE